MRVGKTIVLDGLWAFDAISPDGSTIFATEYASTDQQAAPRYRVRAIDVRTGRPFPGAIVDKREPGAMTGSPVTRAYSPDRAWAYTLYVRQRGTAFVHALDTVHRSAVCIDLPWRGVGQAIWSVRLTVSSDGRVLRLLQRGTPLAEVDLARFTVRALARPRRLAATG
jgi:DNA-binding beta-propeller fold protein YncE